MATSMTVWIERFATDLGVPTPSDADVRALLELAGVAARASERVAAPISCWLVARAGKTPDEALAVAKRLAEAFDG